MIFAILAAVVGIAVGVVGSSHSDSVKKRDADDQKCHALYNGKIDETPKCPRAK